MTTERELFAAYANSTGYAAPCSCGLTIVAPSFEAVERSVDEHNASPHHQEWSDQQAAVYALQRRAARTCPCHGDEA